MIEINLVPDVKLELLRARKTRNLVISIAALSAIGSIAVVGIIAIMLGSQAVVDRITDQAITDKFNKLSSIEDVDNIVTIQKQLLTLDVLGANKQTNSRLFDVLSIINPPDPNSIKVSSVNVDPVARVISIDGLADNGYVATDTFKKTILNTSIQYRTSEGRKNEPLAKEVTLGDTSYGEDTEGSKILRFSMVFTYNDNLFMNTAKDMRFVSPTAEINVTDSRTRVPESLFSAPVSDARPTEGEE